MKTLTVHITITDDEYNLLNKIQQDGSAEYRDPEYRTLNEFLEDNENEQSDWESQTEWFLRRNAGGTYHLIPHLDELGLIDMNYDAWHQTYILTELGKQFIAECVHTET